MITAEILKKVASLNLSAECHAEILRIIVSIVEPIEEKRKKDRERKARVRGKSAGQSADAHIYKNTTNKDKLSKYISAIDVPEVPSDVHREYASGQGWAPPRIEREWQRFRDYGLTKNRKHRGQRGLDAAWRNWVTSPFQKPENPNAKTARNGLGQALQKLENQLAEIERGEDGGAEIIRMLPRG